MARWKADGRVHAPEMTARIGRTDAGAIEIRSPGVGLWRGAPAPGSLVTAGTSLGELEVLGVLHHLVAPDGAHGVVVPPDAGGLRRARLPVGFDDVLLTLDPEAVVGGAAASAAAGPANATGLVFRAPSSGRFYARPAPDKPSFVEVGATIKSGQTIALLEVMKTFNRIAYGGAGLPDPAKIVRVIPEDGADVEEGDPLFELEAG